MMRRLTLGGNIKTRRPREGGGRLAALHYSDNGPRLRGGDDYFYGA